MTDLRLPISVRAWAPGPERPSGKRLRDDASASDFTLIFDTETTTDAAQALRFGCFRVLRGGELVQHGLFYGDIDRTEVDALCEYGRRRRIDVMTVDEFRELFYKYAYELRAAVVGHNLPFDLSRLALSEAPARRPFRWWLFADPVADE